MKSRLRRSWSAIHPRRLRTRFARVDVRRWTRDSEFRADWEQRHALMSRCIRSGDHVVDLGSGPRAFEAQLPPGCSYTPVDVVDRGPGSIVCDFNGESFPAIRADVVIASGVLEYLADVPRFLQAAKAVAGRGAISYADIDAGRPMRLRRRQGWKSHLTRSEFQEALAAAGWDVVSTDGWRDQTIYFVEVR